MADIGLNWDFGDEAANSTTSQINRQKSARNLVILDFDPSVPRAVLFDPRRDNTHSTTLSECACHDFTGLKVRKPCMHIYRLAIELGLLQAKYLDRHALSSFTAGLSREETERLQQLPSESKKWGNWNSEIHASGIQRNREYRGYLIHHVERSVVKAADGWLIHEYALTLGHCLCADFSERRLPCKHIYAAALASSIDLPFTYAEFHAARDKWLELVFEFPHLQSEE
jgi:predicted nucleic acid-binding Zn finger protein